MAADGCAMAVQRLLSPGPYGPPAAAAGPATGCDAIGSRTNLANRSHAIAALARSACGPRRRTGAPAGIAACSTRFVLPAKPNPRRSRAHARLDAGDAETPPRTRPEPVADAADAPRPGA